MDLSEAQVMGILNITPDSFYANSRKQTEEEIILRVRQIIDEGASIIDIGAYSSRPNAENITPAEELKRLRFGLEIIHRIAPDAVISVDTFRAEIAEACVEEYGVAIINDIAAGEMDAKMFETVALSECSLYNDAYARNSARYATYSTLRECGKRGLHVFCGESR